MIILVVAFTTIGFTILTTMIAKMLATRTELKTVKNPISTIILKGKSKVAVDYRESIKTKGGTIYGFGMLDIQFCSQWVTCMVRINLQSLGRKKFTSYKA